MDKWARECYFRPMDRFRYGTKEIIATLSGVILMVVARYAQYFLTQGGVVTMGVFDWIIPTIPVVALAAALFGPITGLLCGVAGNLLISSLFLSYINYPEMVIFGIYGFFMGLYFGKMHYDYRVFSIQKFFDFNAVQIMAGLFCVMFLLPVLRFMFEGADLYDAVIAGAKLAAGDIVLVGIFCSFVLLMVSVFAGSGKKGRRA